MANKGLKISSLLTLPVDAVTSTMVVYGGKGMGKTNFGGVLVEELSANGLKWAVLDPMGVWWGIRHSADGKGKGVECLILGGPHGDIPIEPTGGAVVADLVADHDVNVIIDISRKPNGEKWGIAERIRFVNEYGKQLTRRQGSLVNGRRRQPMMQVIDEAARFIPQMIRADNQDVAKCASTWSAIVEEGRNDGIGVTLITQRGARLNKDVAELADAMLAFRTIGPNSLQAVMDWLSAQVTKDELKAMSQEVRSLPVGSALVVSPGWLKLEKVVAIRLRHTFDSSATPKPGQQAARVRGTGAKPDLAKYSERMKETIERAKDDNPKALKVKIRELEAAAAKKQTIVAAPTKTVSVRDEAMLKENTQLKADKKELQRKLDDRQRKATKLVNFMAGPMKQMVIALEKVLEDFKADAPVAPIAEVVAMPEPPKLAFVAPSRPAQPRAEVFGEKPLTGTALKIAAIAAGYGQRGEGISRKLLATLLGMSADGGGFGGRLSEARTSGAIVTEGSIIRATAEGIARYADAFQAPSTTQEVVDLWSSKITGKARDMFLHLVGLAGEQITRSELADVVGMEVNGGGFGGRLSEARSTGLLVEGGGRVGVNRELLFM